MAQSGITAVGTPLSSAWTACLANQVNGQIVLVVGSILIGPRVTTAGLFSPGCLMIDAGGSSTTTNLFANSGTAASPTWTAVTIS